MFEEPGPWLWRSGDVRGRAASWLWRSGDVRGGAACWPNLAENAASNKPPDSIGIEYLFPLANVGVMCTPVDEGVPHPAVTTCGPSSATSSNSAVDDPGVECQPVGVGTASWLPSENGLGRPRFTGTCARAPGTRESGLPTSARLPSLFPLIASSIDSGRAPPAIGLTPPLLTARPPPSASSMDIGRPPGVAPGENPGVVGVA